jgi:hypothetical protein
MSKDSTKDKEGKIIHINEEQIKDHLGEMVRKKKQGINVPAFYEYCSICLN